MFFPELFRMAVEAGVIETYPDGIIMYDRDEFGRFSKSVGVGGKDADIYFKMRGAGFELIKSSRQESRALGKDVRQNPKFVGKSADEWIPLVARKNAKQSREKQPRVQQPRVFPQRGPRRSHDEQPGLVTMEELFHRAVEAGIIEVYSDGVISFDKKAMKRFTKSLGLNGRYNDIITRRFDRFGFKPVVLDDHQDHPIGQEVYHNKLFIGLTPEEWAPMVTKKNSVGMRKKHRRTEDEETGDTEVVPTSSDGGTTVEFSSSSSSGDSSFPPAKRPRKANLRAIFSSSSSSSRSPSPLAPGISPRHDEDYADDDEGEDGESGDIEAVIPEDDESGDVDAVIPEDDESGDIDAEIPEEDRAGPSTEDDSRVIEDTLNQVRETTDSLSSLSWLLTGKRVSRGYAEQILNAMRELSENLDELEKVVRSQL